MITRLASLLLLCGVVMAARPAGAVTADPIAADAGRHRILLVAAPAADDPDFARQRSAFAAMGAGARERDLILVEAVGPGAQAVHLRRAYSLAADRFAVVLIGKDGGPKLRSDAPLGPDRLFPTIDAMPMRRSEMRRHP